MDFGLDGLCGRPLLRCLGSRDAIELIAQAFCGGCPDLSTNPVPNALLSEVVFGRIGNLLIDSAAVTRHLYYLAILQEAFELLPAKLVLARLHPTGIIRRGCGAAHDSNIQASAPHDASPLTELVTLGCLGATRHRALPSSSAVNEPQDQKKQQRSDRR